MKNELPLLGAMTTMFHNLETEKVVKTRSPIESPKFHPSVDTGSQANQMTVPAQAIPSKFKDVHFGRRALSGCLILALKRIQGSLTFAAVLFLASCLWAQGKPASKPAPRLTWVTTGFSVGIDENGLISSLRNPADPTAMNWVSEIGPDWGSPVSREGGKLVAWNAPAVVKSSGHFNQLLFVHNNLTVRLRQFIGQDEHLTQSYTLTNNSSVAVKLAEGDFGIRIPLPDNYPDAVTSLTRRCNVHIWAGGNTAWINAVRMNGNSQNLGLVLSEGALTSYSIADRPWDSNDRGTFVIHPPALDLAPGQTTTITWSLFWNKGWEDFFSQALRTRAFVRLQADRYIILPGQPLHITAESNAPLAGSKFTMNGQPVKVHITGNRLEATLLPASLGEQRVELTRGDARTFLLAYAAPDPLALIEARVRFVMDHQQVDAPGQPVDGALVAYDNETGQQVLERTPNQNAGCERIAMGILLAKYLVRTKDPHLKARISESLDRYWSFVHSHLEDSTGTVFNDTDDPAQRLYNYPWVARLHLAMYQATNNSRYLDAFVRTIRAYYAKGGQQYYPVDLPISEGLAALSEAKRRAEYDEFLGLFRAHADWILATGATMPKSEVNYEQGMVGPASGILIEVYSATKDRKYLDAATPFLNALFAFNGEQPDYRLHDAAIRHWDDYWFGKGQLFGDTFPQWLSTITALVLEDLAQANPEHASEYHERALNILANNLPLFTLQGKASCAYVYPLTVNGKPGRFYDAWANDQDWALVHYLLVTH
jgi:hypothetical protein